MEAEALGNTAAEAAELSRRRRVLFVCSQNRLRSPTAARLCGRRSDLEVRSAGTDRDANVRVTAELLEWADVVFVMERRHRNVIHKRFRSLYERKRIVCLYIPDQFDFMDPALVELLRARLALHLPSRPPQDVLA